MGGKAYRFDGRSDGCQLDLGGSTQIGACRPQMKKRVTQMGWPAPSVEEGPTRVSLVAARRMCVAVSEGLLAVRLIADLTRMKFLSFSKCGGTIHPWQHLSEHRRRRQRQRRH